MSDMPEEIWAIHVWIDDATWYECFVPGTEKYIRADIHEARVEELEDALSWYEQTVREFATAAEFGGKAELALDSDCGKKARKALAKQHKENDT